MIKEFQGEYRCFSNFWPSHAVLGGRDYLCVEAAYQAAKTLDPADREALCAMDGRQAKKFGRTLTLRSDWNDIRLQVMEALIRQKFAQQPFRDLLLDTGDQVIQEGNWWGDRFWGISPVGSGKGENHLGILIMRCRADLQKPHSL